MRNFNEIFSEDVTYEDTKSHKKPGFRPLFRRKPMSKCDFNKVTFHGCSPVNLLHIFRTPFLNNTSGWMLLKNSYLQNFAD